MECSDSVLLFLEYNYINKVLLRTDIIDGILFTLKYIKLLHVDENCIRNILIFLEIEASIIDQVILDIKIQKNWKVIIEFLENNQNQILRKSL